MAIDKHQSTNNPLGIVAGDGELPFLLVEAILKQFQQRTMIKWSLTKKRKKKQIRQQSMTN